MILTMCQEQGAQPHTFSSISRELGNKTPVEVRWGGSQGDGERRQEDGTNGVYSHKELFKEATGSFKAWPKERLGLSV